MLVLFCIKIHIHTNLCNFWIGNRSTSKTLLEVHHFLAKFHSFGLRNGMFSKIFVLLLVLFCARIQIRTNLCSFLIENRLMSKTLPEVLRFLAKFHYFGLRNEIFFENFCFGALFILLQNSNSHKFMQLFDQKWVNDDDSR